MAAIWRELSTDAVRLNEGRLLSISRMHQPTSAAFTEIARIRSMASAARGGLSKTAQSPIQAIACCSVTGHLEHSQHRTANNAVTTNSVRRPNLMRGILATQKESHDQEVPRTP